MIKNRIQYVRKKKYDGYYYFGMTEKMYENYKDYFKTGRRHEKVKFEKLYIYKLFSELFDNTAFTRFFRIEIPEERGFKEYVENLETSKFDYIGKRVDKKFIPVDYEKRK